MSDRPKRVFQWDDSPKLPKPEEKKAAPAPVQPTKPAGAPEIANCGVCGRPFDISRPRPGYRVFACDECNESGAANIETNWERFLQRSKLENREFTAEEKRQLDAALDRVKGKSATSVTFDESKSFPISELYKSLERLSENPSVEKVDELFDSLQKLNTIQWSRHMSSLARFTALACFRFMPKECHQLLYAVCVEQDFAAMKRRLRSFDEWRSANGYRIEESRRPDPVAPMVEIREIVISQRGEPVGRMKVPRALLTIPSPAPVRIPRTNKPKAPLQ